jgi:hypothetical protein
MPQLVETEHYPTSTFSQWYGVLGGAIAWAMQLQANYALVPYACNSGDMKWIHIASGFFLLLALSAVAVAWHNLRRAKAKLPTTTSEAEASRSSFMGMTGILTSGLFTLIIISHAIPTFIFDPCD